MNEKISKIYLSAEWKKRRLEIMKRDKFICQKCGRNKSLQVHHIHYENNCEIWEYQDNILITLCNKCHKDWHIFTYNKIVVFSRFTKDKTRKKHFKLFFDWLNKIENTDKQKKKIIENKEIKVKTKIKKQKKREQIYCNLTDFKYHLKECKISMIFIIMQGIYCGKFCFVRKIDQGFSKIQKGIILATIYNDVGLRLLVIGKQKLRIIDLQFLKFIDSYKP